MLEQYVRRAGAPEPHTHTTRIRQVVIAFASYHHWSLDRLCQLGIDCGGLVLNTMNRAASVWEDHTRQKTRMATTTTSQGVLSIIFFLGEKKKMVAIYAD